MVMVITVDLSASSVVRVYPKLGGRHMYIYRTHRERTSLWSLSTATNTFSYSFWSLFITEGVFESHHKGRDWSRAQRRNHPQ